MPRLAWGSNPGPLGCEPRVLTTTVRGVCVCVCVCERERVGERVGVLNFLRVKESDQGYHILYCLKKFKMEENQRFQPIDSLLF